MEEPRKVIAGPVRLSYANVWEPRTNQDGKEKFSASIIIPKTETAVIAKIEKAIENAVKDGIERGKLPRGIKRGQLKLPLRDGDEEKDDAAYADAYFVNANSNTQPQIVDSAVRPILDRSEVYSGCYARVSLSFYAFNTNGNKGIACGLGNIQKLRDGDVLGGGHVSAASDFGASDDFLA